MNLCLFRLAAFFAEGGRRMPYYLRGVTGMCMSESGLPKDEGRLIERIRLPRAPGSG